MRKTSILFVFTVSLLFGCRATKSPPVLINHGIEHDMVTSDEAAVISNEGCIKNEAHANILTGYQYEQIYNGRDGGILIVAYHQYQTKPEGKFVEDDFEHYLNYDDASGDEIYVGATKLRILDENDLRTIFKVIEVGPELDNKIQVLKK